MHPPAKLVLDTIRSFSSRRLKKPFAEISHPKKRISISHRGKAFARSAPDFLLAFPG